jgi:3,4-dihydroxy 2-butanone 4-phosphate synthase / GTP cyclohydrolase II
VNYASVHEAVAAIAAGEFVLVVDDEERENEGDLILAAEKATPEKIGFMVRHTSGLICLPVVGERLDELGLPLMVLENTDSHRTAFTVSIDYRHGTTTGISASDRAATIRAVVDPISTPVDFARPGHIFPLRYHEGGTLVRPGHTEAAVDLARLAGLYPAGVLCEIVDDEGGMARGADLERFAKEHAIPMITIADLITHRWRTEPLVERRAAARIPTEFGTFRAVGYKSLVDGSEHIALMMGEVEDVDDVLVRIHSECLTGDTFGSLRCDCGPQLRHALRSVAKEGTGVVVYNRTHEGRGIGLLHKLEAYRLQDEGRDTVEANLDLGFPADARRYGIDAQILRDLGVDRVRLMTNNPEKCAQLETFGVTVTERVPVAPVANAENVGYLSAKRAKLGHLIDMDGEVDHGNA